MSSSLDIGALLCRHSAIAVDPLVHGWRFDVEDSRQGCLAAQQVRGAPDGGIATGHSHYGKAEPYFVKALPYRLSGADSKAMLTGKALGLAIKKAIQGKGVKQTDVAKKFGVRPPSVQDWINRGTIGKDKLPMLWSYFADVAGPAHWGLDKFPVLDDGAPIVRKPEPAIPARGHHEITESELALLDDFAILPEHEKDALRQSMQAKAKNVRDIVDDYLKRNGMKGEKPEPHVEESAKSRPTKPK